MPKLQQALFVGRNHSFKIRYDMEFDFTEVMRNKSDQELIKIIAYEQENYQPAAIKAAQIEFEKRNLNQAEVYSTQDLIEANYRLEHSKAETPLDIHWKILGFLFPGVVLFIISGFLKSQGYDRKAVDLTKWTLYGLAFYILLIIVLTNS